MLFRFLLFYNGNGEESQNKTKRKKTEEPNKSIKEKLNVEQSHTLGN